MRTQREVDRLGHDIVFRDRRPLYLQAVEAIQELVQEQGLEPGDRLPSEVELGALLGVGRSTIREAMGHLELARVVERRRGVGTVLLGPHQPAEVGLETLESLESLAARQGWRCGTRDVQIRSARADDEQALRLEIEPGTPISVITRIKARDAVPMAEMISMVPESIVPLETLRREFKDSITEFMTRRRGQRVRYARAEVTAVAADRKRARRLRVAEREPLLLLDELFLGYGDVVLAWNLLYFVTTGIRLEMIRRIPEVSPVPLPSGGAEEADGDAEDAAGGES